MMNNLEPLGPLSGIGPEQGHEDAAARDSDDHELASFMVQELEEVIFDGDDAFLNRYVYICFARDTCTRFELTDAPRDRNPKYIVVCYSRQHIPRRAPPADCHKIFGHPAPYM
jgi:hypothetical protein